MCFTCGSVRTEDEPIVGPRPVTYTVTPMTVQHAEPLPDMIVAPRIQTVRPSSRSPRASRTSQSSRPRPSSRHSSASVPLRPLSSHTPPLSPRSTHGAMEPDLPYSLHRRRFSAVVVIEHRHTQPHIVNARPASTSGSKPASVRTKDSPRTSERNLGSPVTVSSPGPAPDRGADRGAGPSGSRRRPSQPHVGDGPSDDETPIRIIRYRSKADPSGTRRYSAATSPRGSSSRVGRGGSTTTPRHSGNVSVAYGSPLQHAATAPAPTPAPASPRSSATSHKTPSAAAEDRSSTERVMTSPAAMAAGASATVGVLAQRMMMGAAHSEQRSTTTRLTPDEVRLTPDEVRLTPDEVVRSEDGTGTSSGNHTGSKVTWTDASKSTAGEHLHRYATTPTTPTPTMKDTDRDTDRVFLKVRSTTPASHHSRRRSSMADNPRSSNVSMRSTRSSARERVVVVDAGTGRATREYRR